jgi:predicted transcriptional regulator
MILKQLKRKLWKLKFWKLTFGVGLIDTLFFTIVGLANIVSTVPKDNDNNISIWIGLITFFGLIPIGLGYFLKNKAEIEFQSYQEKYIELELLNIAKEKQGILKLSDIVLALSTSYDEAKQLMQDLISKGMFKMEVDEEGNIYYVFPDFVTNSKLEA